MDCGEVDAVDAQIDSGEDKLQVPAASEPDGVPRMRRDLQAAEECQGIAARRTPALHAAGRCERLDHVGPLRFFQDHDVGICCSDDTSNVLLPSRASPFDVVAQKPQVHGSETLPKSVRYGWPKTSPRRYWTQSRVPWI